MFATQAQIRGTADLQRSWLYSNEEHQVLERAAAILAVPVQDLPSLLPFTHSISNDSEHEPLLPLPLPQAYPTNIQPALTVNTSAASRNVNAVDNGLERADEELLSPFSWHSGSVQSSQWSPEPAYHRVAPGRTNNTTVWDGLGAVLGARGMVDAHYAPPYQQRLDAMPNTSLYGGATLVTPVHTTDFSESSHGAGNTTPELGNPGGSLDSTLVEGWAKFNWAGATEIPQASSLGVSQNSNVSSVDGKEWLDQFQSERICGQETLGMEPQFLDEEVDTFGTNSIPPIMSAQIKLITTTRVLIPMRASILRRLQRLIQANKLRNWFGIYLCLFILLHSCSILTCDENRAAKKYGLETRYVYDNFVDELHASAKTMIYYWHYNNKGSYPFAKDWTSKTNIALAELNEEQAGFLVETAREVTRRKFEFDDIRKSDNFEHDFYFVAQLYDIEWKPSSTM